MDDEIKNDKDDIVDEAKNDDAESKSENLTPGDNTEPVPGDADDNATQEPLPSVWNSKDDTASKAVLTESNDADIDELMNNQPVDITEDKDGEENIDSESEVSITDENTVIAKSRLQFLKPQITNLLKVIRNPWVIANCVVLVIALVMTIVIVSWFKAKTSSINVALTNLSKIQADADNGKTGDNLGNIIVQPFIVHEKDGAKESITKFEIDETLKITDTGKSLLVSAERSFNNAEYKKAMAFYSALLNNNNNDFETKSFLNARLGECYYHAGLFNDAINTLRKVIGGKISNRKNVWRSKYLIAECHMKQGDYDKARKVLYSLMAIGADFTSDMVELTERSYLKIADSFLEEAQLRLVK